MATFGPGFFPPLGPATTQIAAEPQGWDRCVIAGKVVPAKARVLHGSCKYKRDGKPKKGADGANPVYNGLDPQPLSIEFTTNTDAEREALASTLLQYMPRPNRKPVTVSIDHPSLRMIGVDAVDIVGATPLIPVPGSTSARMTLELHHSVPAKKGNATTSPKATPVRKPKNVRATPNPKPTETGNISLPPEELQSKAPT